MSTNLKVRLFKGKTHADGTHPIQLQFYMNGKLKRKGIYSCLEDDWDFKNNRVKSKVKNSSYINSLISEKYTDHERELIKVLNGDNSGRDFFIKKEVLTLDAILLQEANRFKLEKKPGSYDLTNVYRKEIAAFTDSKSLNINDIDLAWFKSYAAYIYSEITVDGKVVKKANIGSSVQKKIKTIRRLIERYSGKVFDEETKDYRQKVNPSLKQKLTALEVHAIEQLDLSNDYRMDCVRDVFLLQIYLRGARIGSLIQAYPEQFNEGRYTPSNGTGKNNVGSKLIPKAQAIVAKYQGKHERLFPIFSFVSDNKGSEFDNIKAAHDLKKSRTALVNIMLKQIAKLAGITKPLSSHIARHTFARMAIDKVNNPMITMDLLGHNSLAVHQAYLNDIRKDDVLDAAADDIFS